jgi:pSer/pThr/pTyr-binding forkhead associated (FHA) protein
MPLIVRLPDGTSLRFSHTFYVGRERGCEVELPDPQVSRRHAEVSETAGRWTIRDLQSSNGLFVNGRRVESAAIANGLTVTFGTDGPTLTIEQERTANAPPPTFDSADHSSLGDDALEGYAQRYFDSDDDEPAGSRTVMIRKAYQKLQQRQKRTQRLIIAGAALLALIAGGYAIYVHRVMSRQTRQAEDIFYGMKRQDMLFAELEQRLAQAGNSPGEQQRAAYMAERQRMLSDYDRYVANLYDRKLNDKERLILRVTRMFGECDVAAPSDYVGEVMHYINLWQSTGRFMRALKRAQDAGYPEKIAAAFIAQGLPPQYFYLAMQESSFDSYAIGPPTRWGIAKGMWQFIPETGQRYGLRPGPMASRPSVDQLDDRFNWEKATPAAARYIKDIYSTDAQASGLLVMASYNWGEFRVIDLLRQMPADPRQRNFWKLLSQYRQRLPGQTYDYVFNIVSAAVIGENPRLFGFPIDNPLAFATQQ